VTKQRGFRWLRPKIKPQQQIMRLAARAQQILAERIKRPRPSDRCCSVRPNHAKKQNGRSAQSNQDCESLDWAHYSPVLWPLAAIKISSLSPWNASLFVWTRFYQRLFQIFLLLLGRFLFLWRCRVNMIKFTVWRNRQHLLVFVLVYASMWFQIKKEISIICF